MPTERDETPETVTIRVSPQIAKQLKAIADHREKMTIAEALDKYAGASIRREYLKVLDEMTEAVTSGGEG